ncbi:MAG: sigma-70 family RNA polymerase sigma factor [Planctomycetaceae bacterium]
MANSDWEDIVVANSGAIVSAALRVLGRLADAEDVAQDVLVEAFQKWTAKEEYAWPGLLRRMAVCRSLDLLRATRRFSSLEFQPIDSREAEVSEQLSHQEVHDRLRSLVVRLPPRESEVFCLACFERLTHEEIAKLLEIPRGAVATLLAKARGKMKAIIPIVHGESR